MAQQKQEQDLNQLLKVRRDKLADLQANGKDPFQQNLSPSTHGDRFHKCDGTVTKGISPDPLRSTIPKT